MTEQKKVQPLQAVKGMNDILPPDSARWEWLEGKMRSVLQRYGYQNVRTPIVEPTALFVRGIGEVTDIVEKEMYAFEDRADKHGQAEHLALRPEMTAGVVRAMIEHSFLRDSGRRLYYFGPMFRREKPQKGRYRQFHQMGVEALGFNGPDVDAEVILLGSRLLRELGLKDGEHVRLELNCLGAPEERRAHREALIAHLEAHKDLLDEDSQRRMYSNPLRVLDTKNPALQDMANAAPKLLDFLGEASLAHFNGVRAILDAAGIAYTINPRLVRGLDYYNLTVFEWVTDKLGSQGTVCGGGRYDGLIEQLGGKPTPAVGFGMGMERMLLLLEEVGVAPAAPVPDAYAVVPSAQGLPQVMVALEALRAAGVSVVLHPGQSSMKSQFKKADASGAAYALVFGEDELARGEVAIKPLRDASASQISRSLALVSEWAAELLPRNA
ncbi:MAG: histidine--tRNA ligase [Roseateles asaccharophilus]|uniref:Histidine--tRNA ligase n=1 Tax=Roseateles asaccharophilus TaxID=582607 RepID=A0A4R6ND30_9BURK|nr:histidine--tRNA ligase [Roseateles asaccharophilus]MDN3543899.1 histidine--tRNA ligase [Roseateles asaccharophilus]TDP11723.1 histidyl-tRNA synthetase [Roseateles asaccharophilus]